MPGARLALVVATEEYSDPALRRLSSPMSDAEALARVLGDPELGGFEVEVLRNSSSQEIAMRLEDLLTDRKPDDVVLVHFSCHGIKDDSGLLYLAAANTKPSRLYSTAVDATLVNRLIRKSRAGQVVLLLDCCYGGAFERGMVPRAAGDVDVETQFRQVEIGGGRGRAVITASSAMEYAFEGSELAQSSGPRPSVFTSALTEGVGTGAADRDQDGKVALGELYDYLYEKVRAANPNQTPGKWEYGTQGEVVIARNPHRRIAGARLPDELVELLSHPFAATRLGAVQELARLASGGNLPLAAAARATLGQMTDDDSRQVSQAAAAALEDTELRLSEDRIDFGSAPVGSPASREVHLGPVPLAGASQAHTECDGISVRRTDTTLVLTLDTSTPRAVDGEVVVRGPAGEQHISVSGTVVDPARRPARVERPQERSVSTTEPVVTTEPRPAPTTVRPPPEEPDEAYADRRRQERRRVAAGVVIGGSLLSLASLWFTWDAASAYTPADQQLLASTSMVWLLPIVVAVLGAVSMVSRAPYAGTGSVLGAAAAMCWSVLLVGLSGIGASTQSDLTGAFWVALLVRFVVLAAALTVVADEARVFPDIPAGGGARTYSAVAVMLLGVVVGVAFATATNPTGIWAGRWIALVILWAISLTAGTILAVFRLPPPLSRLGLAAAVVLFCVDLLAALQTAVATAATFGGTYQFSEAAMYVTVPLAVLIAALIGPNGPTATHQRVG